MAAQRQPNRISEVRRTSTSFVHRLVNEQPSICLQAAPGSALIITPFHNGNSSVPVITHTRRFEICSVDLSTFEDCLFFNVHAPSEKYKTFWLFSIHGPGTFGEARPGPTITL